MNKNIIMVLLEKGINTKRVHFKDRKIFNLTSCFEKNSFLQNYSFFNNNVTEKLDEFMKYVKQKLVITNDVSKILIFK